MNEEELRDELLSRYFNEPVQAPPRLVEQTLQKITASERLTKSLVTAVVLHVIVLILLGVCLLTGPVPLPGKLALLLVFGLSQTSAAAVLLFCLPGRKGTAAGS